ncbi:MAG: EamA family transporter, partial [Chlamydiae bacterium]|nr:EamA family transporter [Chlamydiota bacterium]
FALGHSLLVDSWTPLPVAAPSYGGFLQGILLMTFISNILCYNLYGLMLKKFTATFIAFLGFSSPIFASFMSWLLIGETPSVTIFAATAVLAVGAWLVHSAELKQGYIKGEKAAAVTSQL